MSWEPDDVVLDRFRLVHRLTVGATTRVWRVTDTTDGTTSILKIASGAAGAERIRREARCLERVGAGKPHLPVVRARCMDGATPWIVFEDSGPCSLDSVWIRRAGDNDVFDAAIAVATALVELHRARVVHGDVKPANVVFDSRRTGPARFTLIDLDIGVGLGSRDQRTMTRVCYTPGYSAPETRATPPLVGVQSDVYSLGMSLMDGLVSDAARGHTGWSRVESEQIALCGLDPSRAADVSLVRWLAACVRYDPHQRPQLTAVLGAFQKLRAGRDPGAPGGQAWRRRIAAGGAVVAAAAATVWLLPAASPPEPAPPAVRAPPHVVDGPAAPEPAAEPPPEPAAEAPEPRPPRITKPAPKPAPRATAEPVEPVVTDAPPVAPEDARVTLSVDGLGPYVSAVLVSGDPSEREVEFTHYGPDLLGARVRPGHWTLKVAFAKTDSTPEWATEVPLDVRARDDRTLNCNPSFSICKPM